MLIALLVGLVVALLVYWAVHRLAGVFGAPAQLLVVFDVVLVVVCVLWLLQVLGVLRVIR
jgi:hypothetical protein